jgi:hypothetical protein
MATRASVKNEKQYGALKDKGMSKQRATARSPAAPKWPNHATGRAAASSVQHEDFRSWRRPRRGTCLPRFPRVPAEDRGGVSRVN